MKKRDIRIPQGSKIGSNQEPIYGYKIVEAYCKGGLAAHKTGKGARWKWMVTHERSGLALGVIGAMTKSRAVENMEAALALNFDWTLDEQETIAALREAPGVVVALRRVGESD